MSVLLRVLIIDDSEDDALLIIRDLKKGGYNPVYERVDTAAAMKKALQKKQWDIILCDYTMPKFNAPSALALLKEANIDTPAIIISGTIGEETAVECMRLGAHDYFMKSNLSRLSQAIARELEEADVRYKQKQANQALLKSAKEWQITFDATNDAIWILDQDQHVLRSNKTAERFFHRPLGEMIGKHCWKIVHGTEQPIPECPILHVRKSLRRETLELQEGERWFLVNADPILDEDGLYLGAVHIVSDITERKQYEESLHNASLYTRSLIEASLDPLVTINQEGKITDVNKATETVTGISRGKLVGSDFTDYFTEPKKARAVYQQVLSEGLVRDYPLTIRHTSGSTIDVLYNATVYKNEAGQVQGVFAAARDITERKREEQALRETEERFAAAFHASPNLIAITRMADGKIVDVNEGYSKMLGYSRDESIGKTTAELSIWADSADRATFVGSLEKFGEVNNFETTLRHKTGTHIPVLDSGMIIELQGEKCLLSVAHDITERKQYEESLHNASLYTRSLIEASLDPLVTINQEGKITDVNKATEIITGISRGQLVGSDFTEYFTEPKKAGAGYQQVLSEGLVRDYSLTIRHTSGSTIDVLYNATVYKNEAGQVQGVFAAARDITESKRAEVEIAAVNRVLRMLSDTNQALIHIMDEATLLNEVCRIIVEIGGYRMAWIGFVEQDKAKTIRPVARAGFDSGYIESVNVTWADNERGRGPGGTAIRTGQPCISRNLPQDPACAPWREAAIERGYKSTIALPLISEGQTLGVLAIYSIDTDAFVVKEVEILKELSDDLAFGITALRTRAQRDQTEVELRESEERYRLIAQNTADTIAVFDLNLNPTYISPSITKLRGYSVQEEMTKTLDQMLTPDSLKQAVKNFSDQMALESSGTADPTRTALMELEEYCKDGSTIWVELAASFLRDNNFKPTAVLTVTRDITERKQAEKRLNETLSRLKKAVGTTIQVLGTASEARDPYTAGHQKRVADLARTIATEMGLSTNTIEGIRMAGSIHDIGKLSIPAEILSKPSKLTDIEFSLIKEHPRIGYEMLKDVESPWPLAQIIYQHHERMNGTGYPGNLKGDEIIMEARIMAVADVVEAMASHRPYRPTLGIEAALEEIEKNKGILYDNVVADTCLRLFREKGYQFT